MKLLLTKGLLFFFTFLCLLPAQAQILIEGGDGYLYV